MEEAGAGALLRNARSASTEASAAAEASAVEPRGFGLNARRGGGHRHGLRGGSDVQLHILPELREAEVLSPLIVVVRKPWRGEIQSNHTLRQGIELVFSVSVGQGLAEQRPIVRVCLYSGVRYGRARGIGDGPGKRPALGISVAS